MAILRGFSIRRLARSTFGALVVTAFFAAVAPTATHAQSVSLEINFPTPQAQFVKNIPWKPGMTALAAIVLVQEKKLPLQPSGALLATLWQFFDLDGMPEPFLYSINGVAQTATIFWSFTVNNQGQTVGVAQYVLQDGDLIGFTYEQP